MRENGKYPASRTRVLFLAWGYSIHAWRRIRIFVDDPAFEVCVISNHDYNFSDCRNVLLNRVGVKKHLAAMLAGDRQEERAQGQKERMRAKVRRGLCKILSAVHDNPFLLPLRVIGEIVEGCRDLRTILATVREFRPEVIFLQTLLYPCYLALLLPRDIPLVITFWNGDVLWWGKSRGIERLLKKQIVAWGARRAKAITVNSQAARDACLGYGAQPQNIHLIRYPGVDLKRFTPAEKRAARKDLGITASKVVLCPRGLGGYLNSDIIVEAAASVVAKHPDVLFLFLSGVGMRTELSKHRLKTRELGIEENFRWQGEVTWDAMPGYYGASDVMVSVSSNDSLPNCMLEAMACGVPVILGDIPQLAEWVTEGSNGYLVPPRDPVALADRILQVIANVDGTADLFAQRNRGLVEREADSEKNSAEVRELVKTVAGSPKPQERLVRART